jgi:hypothetical protein
MKPLVNFSRRNFVGFLPHRMLKIKVKRMRWVARGNPDEAELEVTGPEDLLWEMLDWLRYGVEITNESATRAWWGYVHEVQVGVGRFAVIRSLDTLYNRVAVAYSLAQTDKKTVGYRKTTAWAEDSASSGEYGTKEYLSSQGSLSDAAAIGRRNSILEEKKWPAGTSQLNSGGTKVTIVCRGWWYTLGWQYASIPAVAGASYETTGAVEQLVGSASTNTKVIQVINLAGRAMNALGLSVYARKVGSPTDNLVLGLYQVDDNTDAPVGSALGTVTLAGSGLSTTAAWLSGTFSSEVQLDPQKDYCVQVSRSTAADGTNHYAVNVNTALGATSGFFRIWNGSAWVARSPDADMPFIITKNNSVESTNQIRELVQEFGEFITRVEIAANSGVMLPSYRDGDTLTLDEIETLMDSGGTNGRRLLSSVGADRRMEVWEEPARDGTIEYSLNKRMEMFRNETIPVDPMMPPVGVWVRIVDVIPGHVDVERMNHPEIQFLEAVSWDENQGMAPEFRGIGGPEDLFEVER